MQTQLDLFEGCSFRPSAGEVRRLEAIPFQPAPAPEAIAALRIGEATSIDGLMKLSLAGLLAAANNGHNSTGRGNK